MNKKAAVAGGLVAALVVAYGGSTWWAGSKIKSSYETELGELPKHTELVRVVEHKYEQGLFGAVSTTTLEFGCPAVAAAPQPEQEGEDKEDPAQAAAVPPKPVRFTIRDTIHHGPLAGGTTWAAAVIDSELALDDIKSKADIERVFGKAKPVTARTRVAFDGAVTTDLTIAPGKVTEQGQGELVWQGLQARLDMDATGTLSRYEASMPGLDFNDTEKGIHLKLGKLTTKGNTDTSAGGWMIATGKSEFGLESLEFVASKGLDDAAPAATGQKIRRSGFERIAVSGDASIKDGLYSSTATVQGQGKVGETVLSKIEMVSSVRRLEVANYRKIADGWMQAMSAGGCGGKGATKAQQAALKKITDQFAPDLKAMAKYGPETGIDKFMVEIDGRRGQFSYTASLAGVTDEDLRGDGMALLIKRGVVKADARLPVKWLEQIAEKGAGTGQTPPPDKVAGLIDQGQELGFVVRDGEDITSKIEFSEGALKVNGKPFAGFGGPADGPVVK